MISKGIRPRNVFCSQELKSQKDFKVVDLKPVSIEGSWSKDDLNFISLNDFQKSMKKSELDIVFAIGSVSNRKNLSMNKSKKGRKGKQNKQELLSSYLAGKQSNLSVLSSCIHLDKVEEVDENSQLENIRLTSINNSIMGIQEGYTTENVASTRSIRQRDEDSEHEHDRQREHHHMNQTLQEQTLKQQV